MATGTVAASTVKPLNVHKRGTFVPSTAVKETALTTKIIDAIMPYFPLGCKVISGYLTTADLYWKVNYHYDILMDRIDKLAAMPGLDAKLKAACIAIKNVLLTNPPTPKSGYKNDKLMGQTKDASPLEQIIRRHAIVKQSKKDFETVIVKANVVTASKKNNPPEKEKQWWLAVAPVALPANGTHSTGYALDISGNNLETTRICKALKASLVFNEASHVHVEFANGVTIPG